MTEVKRFVASLMALLMITPIGGFAANHRSAPISSLDHPAGITDWYAFVSYDDATKVTMIMNVDPLLEPSNGPNYFPFDPNVVYTMKVDNNYDAVADLSFEFRFTTEIRAPGIPVSFIGAFGGINAPANAPAPLTTTGTALPVNTGRCRRDHLARRPGRGRLELAPELHGHDGAGLRSHGFDAVRFEAVCRSFQHRTPNHALLRVGSEPAAFRRILFHAARQAGNLHSGQRHPRIRRNRRRSVLHRSRRDVRFVELSPGLFVPRDWRRP